MASVVSAHNHRSEEGEFPEAGKPAISSDQKDHLKLGKDNDIAMCTMAHPTWAQPMSA